MNFHRLERRIYMDEGFRSEPYLDSVGVFTIGVGATTWNGQPVTAETPPVSLDEARIQLRAHIYQSLIDCQDLYPNWSEIDPVRAEVLVNMCFNLGKSRLRKFVKMNAHIADMNLAGWAREMRRSRWYVQVGDRSKRLRAAVISGGWAE